MHLYIKLLLRHLPATNRLYGILEIFSLQFAKAAKFFSILERGPGDNNFRLFSHDAQLIWTMPGTITLSPVGFNISNIGLWQYAPSWFAYCQNTQRRRNHLRHQLACVCDIHCSSVCRSCRPLPRTLKSTLAWLSTSTCTSTAFGLNMVECYSKQPTSLFGHCYFHTLRWPRPPFQRGPGTPVVFTLIK